MSGAALPPQPPSDIASRASKANGDNQPNPGWQSSQLWALRQLKRFSRRRNPEPASDRSSRSLRSKASAPASLLQVMSCDELLKLEIPPKQYLLEPWLPVRGLSMIYAPRGVGKTLFALAVAHAIASGSTFLRFKAPERRRVLYIDGEMPLQIMQERLAALNKANAQEPLGDQLRFLCSDVNDWPMPDLGTSDGQRALEPLIADVDLIVIDNISTLVRTGCENESDSWRPVQEWGLQQRRAGRAVLFVHHTNKSGAQRGTSSREDVLDTVISLSRPLDYESGDGARFVLTFEKARGFYGSDADPLEVRYGTHDGTGRWNVEDPVDGRLEEAKRLYTEGQSVREVAKAMGISKSAAGRLRQRANPGADNLEVETCPAVPGG